MQAKYIDPLKELPVGISNFAIIFNGNYYYIDKTPFIKSVFKNDSPLLITRPRVLGKRWMIQQLKTSTAMG